MDTPKIEINDIIQVQDMDDPDSLSYHSRVEDIAADHMMIAWPTSNGVLVPVHQNCTLSLSFVREDAAYVFKAVVRERKNSPVPLLKIQDLSSPERVQRRQFFRMKVPVRIKIQGVMSMPDKPNAVLNLIAQAYNLSGSGFAIRSETAIPVGTIVDVHLTMDSPTPLKLAAKAVNSELIITRDGRQLSHVGFKFFEIKEGQRMRIMRYLFRSQIKQIVSLDPAG
jgi:c-di-GMP-binding flagellar brake protein YcgR